MPTAILYNATDTLIDGAISDARDLWLSLNDLERAAGWLLKPEGACLGDLCISLPEAQRERFVRDENTPAARFNLAELSRHLAMPSLYDEATDSWCFADAPAARSLAMASLEAPEFTLPDLAGKLHSLTEYRGQKIFMVAWASW